MMDSGKKDKTELIYLALADGSLYEVPYGVTVGDYVTVAENYPVEGNQIIAKVKAVTSTFVPSSEYDFLRTLTGSENSFPRIATSWRQVALKYETEAESDDVI